MKVELWSYWHADREDNFTAATPEGRDSALAAGYQAVRLEAEVFDTEEPETVPLNLYYSPSLRDNITTVTAKGAEGAEWAEGADDPVLDGYHFVRIEGYVYPPWHVSGAMRELSLYWHEERGDHFLTATKAGEDAAKDAGYECIRREGYAPGPIVIDYGAELEEADG